ncbi:MAG: hypothetical protein KME21_13915 [Desmonostoc vinosum HA7617-LM4]|jgi:hypothetical protein|nr:hypothetical protein [Desmonostoc vinosum HA7617-LM4]
MLAQFQRLYPNGSLISELVQIFQGKYIVRVSVQVEGVTRATGMAAAETVEAAEDQARNRALMVLGITNVPQATAFSAKPPISQAQPNPTLNTSGSLSEFTYSATQDEDFDSDQWSVKSDKETSVPIAQGKKVKSESVITKNEQYDRPTSVPIVNDTRSPSVGDRQDSVPNFAVTTANQESLFDPPAESLGSISSNQIDHQSSLGISASNVTPFVPRNYGNQEDTVPQTTTRKKKKSEPVDLSDVIAKTDVELQRLGWTPEQGREHLIKTYGKRGRTLLTEEELHGFLQYLQSQPDPVAGF